MKRLCIAFLVLPLLGAISVDCSGSDSGGTLVNDAGVADAASTDASLDARADVESQDGGGCPGTMHACGGQCFDLQNDNAHCGACDKACPASQACTRGTCEVVCASGQLACNGVCTSIDTDNANCGGCGHACPTGKVCSHGQCAASCASDLTTCGDHCANTQSDPSNCGACGTACPGNANAVAVCGAGHCGTICMPNYADCNLAAGDGCEVNLQSDATHCGSCGKSCMGYAVSSATCSAGVCSITSCSANYYADCDKDPANGCETYTLSAQNCGSCGRACPTGPNVSYAYCNYPSVCGFACSWQYYDCDNSAANGCETNLFTDSQNCGYCGHVCPANMACSSGGCLCTVSGLSTCNSACTDTSNDSANCGGCGIKCFPYNSTSATCTASKCTPSGCKAGWDDCDGNGSNGCETHLRANVANCGSCGHACASGEACSAGTCVAASACEKLAAPKVLIYHALVGSIANELPSGSSMTVANDTLWTSYTSADFAKYDLIVIDSGQNPTTNDLLSAYSTRATWSSAINGRVLVNGYDEGGQPGSGAAALRTAAYKWLTSGTGTALYVGSDLGSRSLDYLNALGSFSSTATGYYYWGVLDPRITSPAHPVMAGITEASLYPPYGAGASLTVPSDYEVLLVNAPSGVPLIAARDVLCAPQ